MTIRVIILMCCLPLMMGADIYRYVDANGVVNYVQQLPFGVQGERIRTVAGASTIAETAVPEAPKPVEPALDPKQQAMLDDLKKADQARREEIANIREANCTRSREVLERLSISGRIRVAGPDGQERAMPEDERQSRIQEAQRGVVTNCSPEPAEPAKPGEPAIANADH